MEKRIVQGLDALGLNGRVPENAAEKLAVYGRLLLEKNQVMNLTAIRDEEGVASLHMLDCAALLNTPGLELQGGKTLIDVGTGAGFPGMVLKVLIPELQVTLLDSLGKRLVWLEEVADALGLQGVRAVHARAEEQSRLSDFRERFDFAAARAVADLRILCELCLPYVKPGGLFLAMKSVDCAAELDAAARIIKTLGGHVETVYDYTIPGPEIAHRVIAIRKLSPTPGAYPRKWAKMQKEVSAGYARSL